MKKFFIITAILQMILSSFLINDAASWNEETHKIFSEFGAENFALNKNKGDYLKNLGFDKDLLEEFKWNEINRPVKKWIAEGAFFKPIANL